MLMWYAPVGKEQFFAFSRPRSNGFQFVLASDSLLILCDVRKPLMPLLYWAHDLGKPSCYIDVFKLSELRSQSSSEMHEWATESGFCIIVGSFWDCEFRLFCYGPYLPACKESITSGIQIVREDALPGQIDWGQKKEMVLGFGILN
ncbi:hypothetical protein SLEP1_g13176 [Rubroshorea leprosula]|uniref:Glutamine amidotransferase type-2 domain-containing protein n=1 Tax=Rubroshorea leprosula TaxID=152421 RepID=A0AAV5IPN5_9ROSI|nr:hypothetical protein SLEP1_g13176 [Rubroshorea leprosula]